MIGLNLPWAAQRKMMSDRPQFGSTLDAVYVCVVPWSEFPIVPSYPHYPHSTSRGQHNAEQATQRITNSIQGNAGKVDAKDRAESSVGKDAKR